MTNPLFSSAELWVLVHVLRLRAHCVIWLFSTMSNIELCTGQHVVEQMKKRSTWQREAENMLRYDVLKTAAKQTSDCHWYIYSMRNSIRDKLFEFWDYIQYSEKNVRILYFKSFLYCLSNYISEFWPQSLNIYCSCGPKGLNYKLVCATCYLTTSKSKHVSSCSECCTLLYTHEMTEVMIKPCLLSHVHAIAAWGGRGLIACLLQKVTNMLHNPLILLFLLHWVRFYLIPSLNLNLNCLWSIRQSVCNDLINLVM